MSYLRLGSTGFRPHMPVGTTKRRAYALLAGLRFRLPSYFDWFAGWRAPLTGAAPADLCCRMNQAA